MTHLLNNFLSVIVTERRTVFSTGRGFVRECWCIDPITHDAYGWINADALTEVR